VLADEAKTAQFLANKGEVLTRSRQSRHVMRAADLIALVAIKRGFRETLLLGPISREAFFIFTQLTWLNAGQAPCPMM